MSAHQDQLLAELRALESTLTVQLKSMELISGMQRGYWFSAGAGLITRGFVMLRKAVQNLEQEQIRRAA